MKKWTVKHRDKVSHKVVTTTVEAESRVDVYPMLKSMGISAISVTEGEVKHQSSKRYDKHILAVLVIIAVTVGICYWIRSVQSNEPSEESKPRSNGRIAEVTPAKGKVVQEEDAVAPKPRNYWDEHPRSTWTDVDRRRWWAAHQPPAGYTNKSALVEAKPEYAIFSTRAENEIACYMTLEPGKLLVGTPVYNEQYKKDFIESLKTPILDNPEDTVEQKELKQAMREVREDLKVRLAAGEDLGDILHQTREELQKLSMYKSQIQHQIDDFIKRKDVSIEDVDDFVTAANMMLDEKGIAPIKLGVITREMIKLNSIRDDGETDGEDAKETPSSVIEWAKPQ